MNGININQFQFEYDLTWMAFFQNEEGRTYLRYGGREDHSSESHLNKESLIRAMNTAQRLHSQKSVQPVSKYEPVGDSRQTPEDIPTMKKMMSKRKESCIHCHDVKVATLRHSRELGQLEKDMIFTYPSPSNLGWIPDPSNQTLVSQVVSGSAAEKAGIKSGDLIQRLNGHRVNTFADMTRVLEFSPSKGTLAIDIKRGGAEFAKTVQLVGGWRKNHDPSWRASAEVVGPNSGFWGTTANQQQRSQLRVDENELAIRVTFIWGRWAKQAGIQVGDFVLAVDDSNTPMNIRQLQSYMHLKKNWGDSVVLKMVRKGKARTVTMQLPIGPPE